MFHRRNAWILGEEKGEWNTNQDQNSHFFFGLAEK